MVPGTGRSVYLFSKDDYHPFSKPWDSPIGNIALHVQRAGEADPVLIMDDFGQKRQSRLRCNIALSPDGNTAIVPMYEMSKEYIVQANLNIGSLELLPFPSDWNDISVGKWSPDGRWLIFGSTIDDYFWEFFQQSEPSEKAIRVIDSLSSHDWAGDSEWLVYQDGNAIYVVSPQDDQSPIKILDLPGLPEYTIVSLWVE